MQYVCISAIRQNLGQKFDWQTTDRMWPVYHKPLSICVMTEAFRLFDFSSCCCCCLFSARALFFVFLTKPMPSTVILDIWSVWPWPPVWRSSIKGKTTFYAIRIPFWAYIVFLHNFGVFFLVGWVCVSKSRSIHFAYLFVRLLSYWMEWNNNISIVRAVGSVQRALCFVSYK